ncbi:MAG TPA: hypothetical protein VK645_13340 [Chitinophagaceae bacterium]|nr:hypothetical protein [Chitinophagaceae bacterium]
MPISLDKYRAKLVIRILYSLPGQDAVKYIQRTVLLLKRKNLATDTIKSFIDKIINQLESVRQVTTDTFKWQNIAMAILVLSQIRQQL